MSDKKPDAPELKADAKPKTFEELHAETLKEKIAAGLSREQAVEVIKAQLANDAEVEAAEKKKAEKK